MEAGEKNYAAYLMKRLYFGDAKSPRLEGVALRVLYDRPSRLSTK